MISSQRLTGRRHWRVIAAVVIAAVLLAMLAPFQQARGDTSAGGQVAAYNSLSQAQRADLMSIARDTWKFYGPDIDSATSLPMDNLTFAGGSATPTAYGQMPGNVWWRSWRELPPPAPYANCQATDPDFSWQRDFANDPVAWAAHTYLSIETMSL